MSDKYLYINP